MSYSEEPEPVAARPRGRFWRLIARIYLYVFTGLLLAVAAAGFAAFLVYDQVMQPGKPGPAVAVEVPTGATGQQVGVLLAEKGLVEHEAFFRLALKFDKEKKPIKSGIYDLPQGLSALELLHLLQRDPSRPLAVEQFRVTVPEGLSLRQMAALFEDPGAFLKAASDPGLIARLGLKVSTLEGFLMPETYYFDKPPSMPELVNRMFAQFEKNYAEMVKTMPGTENYDKLGIVTIASLVEEEAKLPDERPLIAAVMYNRLDAGMLLQMDSTLQYALNKYGERMMDSDKETDSPYNTYRNKGLPPGPISSPGKSSLEAALHPASVDYLYFVSNADGQSHTFSSSLQAHEQAVAKFRRDIAPLRRVQREQQAGQR